MIGNDVISLIASSNSPKSRSQRFMNKIFTINELGSLKALDDSDREQWIWLFWSMKESSYKSFYKQFRKRLFAPKMFDCYIIDSPETMDCGFVAGTVKTLFQDFCTQSYLLEDCIHTIAFINERQVIHDHCFPIDSDEYVIQARTVRNRLCDEIADLEGCSCEMVKIQKDARGIPRAYIDGKVMDFDISLSHHGTFGAYAISHGLD